VSGKYKSDQTIKTKTSDNENQEASSQINKATGTLRSYSSPNNLNLQLNKAKNLNTNQSLLVRKSALTNGVDKNVQPIIVKSKSNSKFKGSDKNSQKQKNPFFY
jgi:hypothetical protein